MTYAIKYIQEMVWDKNNSFRTSRGWEAWINLSGGFSKNSIDAKIYNDVNLAYKALEKLLNGSSWYYLVEEI